jgi:predicted nucleic acid-binding protein
VILVDTNAWIHHLRIADKRLIEFLVQGRVRTCEIVIGELLLGAGLPKGFAKDLAALPRVQSPRPAETRAFVERHHRSFAGSGIGWADAQILHAASNAGAKIHTADRAVRRVAKTVRIPIA